MNSMSAPPLEDQPGKQELRVIFGDEWEDESGEDHAARPRRKRSNSWVVFRSSPLARRIITYNLLAMFVLMFGIMYLSQSTSGAINQRLLSMEAEARLLSQVIGAQDQVDQAAVEDVAVGFSAPNGGVLSIYGSDRTALLDQKVLSEPAEIQGVGGTAITDSLNRLWNGFTKFLVRTDPVADEQDATSLMVTRALEGKVSTRRSTTPDGALVLAVSVPVSQSGKVQGAVVYQSLPGSVDRIVRQEREVVLRLFLLAIAVSVILSIVLANTIANPLRDLAYAAEGGAMAEAGESHPDRVRIPDMTARPDEIGRLSSAMRGMTEALYERIDSNQQFAADVAHEIKNPLASLRSAVETMRIAKDEKGRARLLEVIEHDVRRLDRLVSDISNASRLDAELVREDRELFDLTEMLNRIVEFNLNEAEVSGAELIWDKPKEPVMFAGLEARLAQVFVNLLTNAISFCDEGDAVRIWTRKKDNRILVVVEDTGPGIPDKNLKQIFSRFYSERPADDFGNHSGLGLAISKQIVEAHGGVIWAENIRAKGDPDTAPPLGARFVVGLPV